METGNEKHVRDTPEGRRCYVPARYVFLAVLIVGIFANILLRASLPIAMTTMVRRSTSTATSDDDETDTCPGGPAEQEVVTNNSAVVNVESGEFDWDEVTQNTILTASTYGGLVTTMIGGRLAEVWNTKYMFATCYGVSAAIYMLLPITAEWSVVAIIVFQVIGGLIGGPLQPVMMNLFATWFPAQERPFLGGIMFSAINVGSIVSSIITGNLLSSMGWRFVFYLFSSLITAWTIMWMFLVYESPNHHPRISEEERIYITESTKKDEHQSVARLPWKEILLSGPIWAHIAMCTPGTWMGATLSNALPTYMKNILHYDTAKIGNITAVPTFAGWVSLLFFGFLSQWIRRKQYLSQLATYHVFNGVSTLIPAVFVICITFVGCNDVAVIILLTLVNILSSAYIGGSQLNQMDLAVNYTGTIVGLTATVENVVQIVAPMITGVLTNNKQTLTAWNTVFYIVAGVKIIPFFIYLFFGSVEEQPWNRINSEEEDNTEKSLTDDPEAQSQVN